ncbi:MAG: hypothetical protein ACXVPU_15015, partial [Bacteroidia bacterium]
IKTLTDNKGNTNKVKFYARAPKKGALDVTGKPLQFDPERMDALMNNGKDFVMLQYFTFGKVMPPATYFQKGKEQTIVPVNKPPTKPKA